MAIQHLLGSSCQSTVVTYKDESCDTVTVSKDYAYETQIYTGIEIQCSVLFGMW